MQKLIYHKYRHFSSSNNACDLKFIFLVSNISEMYPSLNVFQAKNGIKFHENQSLQNFSKLSKKYLISSCSCRNNFKRDVGPKCTLRCHVSCFYAYTFGCLIYTHNVFKTCITAKHTLLIHMRLSKQ